MEHVAEHLPAGSHEHEHGHDHDDDGHHVHSDGLEHDHVHPGAGAELAPGGGPVLLDIGGDIGAVIARLDDHLAGTELGILSLDDPDWDPTTHTGVWRRPTASGQAAVVAVYPELRSGRYRITVPGQTVCDFDVAGGRITELDLRTVE